MPSAEDVTYTDRRINASLLTQQVKANSHWETLELYLVCLTAVSLNALFLLFLYDMPHIGQLVYFVYCYAYNRDAFCFILRMYLSSCILFIPRMHFSSALAVSVFWSEIPLFCHGDVICASCSVLHNCYGAAWLALQVRMISICSLLFPFFFCFSLLCLCSSQLCFYNISKGSLNRQTSNNHPFVRWL